MIKPSVNELQCRHHSRQTCVKSKITSSTAEPVKIQAIPLTVPRVPQGMFHWGVLRLSLTFSLAQWSLQGPVLVLSNLCHTASLASHPNCSTLSKINQLLYFIAKPITQIVVTYIHHAHFTVSQRIHHEENRTQLTSHWEWTFKFQLSSTFFVYDVWFRGWSLDNKGSSLVLCMIQIVELQWESRGLTSGLQSSRLFSSDMRHVDSRKVKGWRQKRDEMRCYAHWREEDLNSTSSVSIRWSFVSNTQNTGVQSARGMW